MPIFFKGANAADVKALATKTDTVRGAYMDNTDVAKWLLNTAWVANEEAPTEEAPTEEAPTEEAPTEEAPTEEAPTEEAPTEEAPSEEDPSEEAPTEEAPSQEAPSEEAPSEDAEDTTDVVVDNTNDAQGPSTGGDLARTGVNTELVWGAGLAATFMIGGMTVLLVNRARRAEATLSLIHI